MAKLLKVLQKDSRGYLILLVMPFFDHLSKQRESRCSSQQDMTFKTKFMGGVLSKSRIILAVCLWILLSKMVGGIASILFEFCFNMSGHESILFEIYRLPTRSSIMFEKIDMLGVLLRN